MSSDKPTRSNAQLKGPVVPSDSTSASPERAGEPTTASPSPGLEALAQRIASRAERFTPEELDMIEAFGFARQEGLNHDHERPITQSDCARVWR
jgi:hypothetical protein